MRAPWVPELIDILIRKRYGHVTNACKANDINLNSLKNTALNPSPGLVNVVKLAQDLAQGDPKLAWEIVTSLAGQSVRPDAIIVPVEQQKMQEKPYTLSRLNPRLKIA